MSVSIIDWSIESRVGAEMQSEVLFPVSTRARLKVIYSEGAPIYVPVEPRMANVRVWVPNVAKSTD